MFSSSELLTRARTESRGRRWFLELLIFLLVFSVAFGIEGLVSEVGSVVWLVTDPDAMSGIFDYLSDADGWGNFSEYIEIVMGAMPSWLMLLSLYATPLLTLTVVLYCRKIEKRSLHSMGLQRTGAVREYVAGAVLGSVLFTAAVGVGVLTGVFTVSVSEASPLLILLYLGGYLLQGMSEEVLCRGYLMVSLARENPPRLALILSSLVFAALHLANPGITPLAFLNLFLCGMVFGVYVLRRGSLWGACAIHSFWNFVQGNIFGFRVSGSSLETGGSVLTTYLAEGRNTITGGIFGAEGGLCVTLVMTAALALLLLLPRPAVKTIE